MAITRREFVIGVAAAGVAMGVERAVAQPADNSAAVSTPPATGLPDGAAELRWLDGAAPAAVNGVTWGVSWPRGKYAKDQVFSLRGADGQPIPSQSWPIAYWPDGSVKWTAHAAGPALAAQAAGLRVEAGRADLTGPAVTVKESSDAVEVDTGAVRCVIPRQGEHLIASIERGGKPTVANGRLVCLRQDAPQVDGDAGVKQEAFAGRTTSVTVEQAGPVRAVVRVEGKHVNGAGREWLPFAVRLYFYAGSDAARLMHTFVFDGDEHQDYIRGLGVRFDVAMRDLPHDRHVRFAGEGAGLWAEAVRNLAGLRRDPGRAIVDKQLAGEACPPLEDFPDAVRNNLQYVPQWDGYSLFQSSADAFVVRKKTAGDKVCWVTASHGGRAAGFGYIGGPSGGAAFALRDFWQRHPTELSVAGATTDAATVTAWLWSPSAPPMDLRFYHDGMGEDTYEKQLAALDITYEDYEPGFATPFGIARTSELTIWALPATPTRRRLVELAASAQSPPALVCAPEHYAACKVFGSTNWALPDRSSPSRAAIEDALDWHVDYYRGQVEQRKWYGFWDYGDFRHTYDAYRHEWRYDVGGFAWDNSELSPDLWLWLTFLRTGRAATFRLAEALMRHTGEVDTYHAGRFKGLGTRHGVVHWGDSAKQMRVSTAAYRRFYYYLSGGDERVGDLMRDLVHADEAFANLDPNRKVRTDVYKAEPHRLAVGFGTDWGSIAAALLAEWERTGDAQFRDKLVNSMKSIAAMPHGFFTGSGAYDPDTGLFVNRNEDRVFISHLNALFGLPEVVAELIDLIDVPEFEKAWLDYCTYYNADARTRAAALGFNAKTQPQRLAHSRLTAYAAKRKHDPALAARAWDEFFGDDLRSAPHRYDAQVVRVEGPAVLTPVDEAAWVSTNDTAQWSLAAIECLSLIGDSAPAKLPLPTRAKA